MWTGEKLLVAKIISLWKHAKRRKALTAFGRVKKGEFYFLSTNQHVKNEHVFFARHRSSVIQQVVQGQVVERRRKLVQFHVFFWLLTKGRPMT
jgi:hypothetical protein